MASYVDRCCWGFACPHAHGSKEQLYHPSYYKTHPCTDTHTLGECPRGGAEICAFYHGPHDRRYIDAEIAFHYDRPLPGVFADPDEAGLASIEPCAIENTSGSMWNSDPDSEVLCWVDVDTNHAGLVCASGAMDWTRMVSCDASPATVPPLDLAAASHSSADSDPYSVGEMDVVEKNTFIVVSSPRSCRRRTRSCDASSRFFVSVGKPEGKPEAGHLRANSDATTMEEDTDSDIELHQLRMQSSQGSMESVLDEAELDVYT